MSGEECLRPINGGECLNSNFEADGRKYQSPGKTLYRTRRPLGASRV